jgi:hypothetical protein
VEGLERDLEAVPELGDREAGAGQCPGQPVGGRPAAGGQHEGLAGAAGGVEPGRLDP